MKDELDAVAKEIAELQQAVKETKDDERKFPVNLRVALINEAEGGLAIKERWEGRLTEISTRGFSLHSGHNLRFTENVVALIVIPPKVFHLGGPRIVEVECKMLYTVYAGEAQCFRTVFDYITFKRDGESLLKSFLTHRAKATSI